MNNPLIGKEFEKLVKNKFNLYNSLLLNLPYPNINNVGIVIPLLHNEGKQGLDSGKDPLEILDFIRRTPYNVQALLKPFLYNPLSII
jgi:phosphoenolpyruvate carboxylase